MSGGDRLAVTIVVIAYRSEGRIAETVASHEAALAHLDGEVIIVDNASGDRGAEEARAVLTRGTVVENLENVGYGGAANQGIAMAKGRACIIMNDDARLGPEDVDRLLAVLDSDPRIGLVGPRIVDEAGRPMPSARTSYPGPMEEFERLLDVVRGRNRNKRYVSETDPTDVAWLVGACVMGPTDLLARIGGFNPEFFLYGEDIDLARRVHAVGRRVVTVPDATCVHVGGVSTGEAFADRARVERRAKARDIYYRIWLPRPVRMLVHLRRAIGLRHQPWRLGFHLPKALWDGPSLKDARFPEPL